MTKNYISPHLKYLLLVLLLALLIVLCSLVCLSTSVFASGGSIHDVAHVLDGTKVEGMAEQISTPVDIYTTAAFSGSKSDFDAQTLSMTKQYPDHIIMNIDTLHRHLAIDGGSAVFLQDLQYNNAVIAFGENIHGTDYTSGTLAALQSLKTSLEQSSNSSSSDTNYTAPASAPSSSLFSGFGVLLIVAVLVAIGARVYRAVMGIPEPPSSRRHSYDSSDSAGDRDYSSSSDFSGFSGGGGSADFDNHGGGGASGDF